MWLPPQTPDVVVVSGWVEDLRDTGIGEIRNGQKSGAWITYDNEEDTIHIEAFRQGVPHGSAVTLERDGRATITKDVGQDGAVQKMLIHSDGHVRRIASSPGCFFKDVTLDFWPDGSLSNIGCYTNGALDGAVCSWSDDGLLWRVTSLRKGVLDGLLIELRPNWGINAFCFYRDDMKNGPYARYGTDGKLAARGSFKAGRLHGRLTVWEGDILLADGVYRDGKPWDGMFRAPDPEYGNLLEVYKDGQRVQ
jgi:antitoxin component YwqK of YwqJK toxin-antitoxin module